MNLRYNLLSGIINALSRLPWRALYAISDVMRLLVYHVVRYRRRVVRDNLTKSFPEKGLDEIKCIEREFYSFFCDYVVETVKLYSISFEEMKERMKVTGVDAMVRDMEREGKLFGFVYLAHFGCWEWVSSIGQHIHDANPDFTPGQVYHPLRNRTFDRLFLYLRGRFGATSIPMKETLRFVLEQRQAKRPTIIGFIADQSPKRSSTHHWTDFMHRKTPVFIGTEKIGKRVDALFYYSEVKRVRRGYYTCEISRMTDDGKRWADYELTDFYFRMLEETIKSQPSIWLWTHKRWKRTYEDYLNRLDNVRRNT